MVFRNPDRINDLKDEEQIPMKRVCAWCEIVMESTSGDSDLVTHGICPACFDNLMGKEGTTYGAGEDRDSSAMNVKN